MPITPYLQVNGTLNELEWEKALGFSAFKYSKSKAVCSSPATVIGEIASLIYTTSHCIVLSCDNYDLKKIVRNGKRFMVYEMISR